MKSIRDSVHGTIVIPKGYVSDFIDTPHFQRLRRIEQTAIRSIYPSARHDRFIHSLGVYYIGDLIQNHLAKDLNQISQEEAERIRVSYVLACLLHDVAHAPFSHTFESYYGKKDELYERLNIDLKDDLAVDMKDISSVNYHEYASAILCAEVFGEQISQHKGDVSLVCRMIIGCKYLNDNVVEHQIANIFISLIHGDVLDADRLDYACRDVWASGYSTSTIDVKRIVSSLHIKMKNEKYALCMDSRCINDLWNMLEVRKFQNRYVINHHSVQYEQKLMVLAAEKSAHFIHDDKNLATEALHEFINLENCIQRQYSDEDLLTMIKQCPNNEYKDEFLSRQYTRLPLWKTIEEFYAFFPDVPRNIDLKISNFEEQVRLALQDCLESKKIIVCGIKFKKSLDLKDLCLLVNDKIVEYGSIYPSKPFKYETIEMDREFYYVFVPKDKRISNEELRSLCIEKLRPLMSRLYPIPRVEEELLHVLQIAMNEGRHLPGFDFSGLQATIEALINNGSLKIRQA